MEKEREKQKLYAYFIALHKTVSNYNQTAKQYVLELKRYTQAYIYCSW